MITSRLRVLTTRTSQLRAGSALMNKRGYIYSSNDFATSRFKECFGGFNSSFPLKCSIRPFSVSPLTDLPKETKKPNIMFLTNSHNGMSQRAKTVLEDRGFTVNVELAVSPTQMIKSTKMLKPDIIICPFLTAKVPEEIWKNPDVPCVIVHPGVQGDRGMSSIEWAMEGESAFGVTCLSAVEEMDAGPVWATRVVEPSNRVDPSSLTKSSIYKHEITEAAIDAIEETIFKFMNGVPPTEVDIEDPNTLGTLRPTMSLKDRKVSFADHTAQQIVHRIRQSDGQPGAKVTLRNDMTFFAFDAHVEEASMAAKLLKYSPNSVPGDIIAKRSKALAFLCKDGEVIWIGHAKQKKNSIKLPASQCLKSFMAEDIPEWPLVSTEFVVQTESELWKKPVRTYMEHWTCTMDNVSYIFFDVYNGAMDTEVCKQVEERIQVAASRSDVDAIVLVGGYNAFSNGINLNLIESAKQNKGQCCEQESWENINAINDVVRALFSVKDKVTFSALRGSAGAGGVMMALAADEVWTHSNVVLNPHYLAMGLHGSEYWTSFLPERVGKEVASQLTQEKQAISAQRATQLGMVDQTFGDNVNEFQQGLHQQVTRYVSLHRDDIIRKKQQALTEENLADIERCRATELAIMKENFQSEEYKTSRHAFVSKQKPLATPVHLTSRRGQVMSGKKVASKLLDQLAAKLEKRRLAGNNGRSPKLAILLVGDRTDSKLYVEKKIKVAEQLGITADLYHYCGPENGGALQEQLIEKIHELNDDKTVDGIMLQVPTTMGVNPDQVVPSINPRKDVDCLNPANFHVCLDSSSRKFLPPCPKGMLDLLLAYGIPLKGQHAVVVGSSANLGWPIACLLEREGCQVTVLNIDGSSNVKDYVASASIVVSAVGKSGIITEDMVKPGAVLVDAGISFDDDGKVVGDISSTAKKTVAAMYTPVPNGVGPMTVAKLMENVVKSYEMSCEDDEASTNDNVLYELDLRFG